jgi:DNA topoisomerase-6 subunit A
MTEEKNNQAVSKLYSIAESIYDQIDKGQIPRMVLPLRTKKNIKFDRRTGVWKYGKDTGARSAKRTRGAQMLLRTMYMMEFIQEMIESKKSSTLREMYYISEGWE